MMNLVPFVEYVCHELWWGSVDNCRADDVGHITVILVLRDVELFIAEELANSSEVNITRQDGYSDRLKSSKVL